MKLQKVFAVILTFLVILSALAGCSSDTGDSSSTGLPDEISSSSSANSLTETPSTNNRSSFTNKYGTSTTKCAHSGCDNYIASSGDTNCCTVHSNKCLECGKYIDEDAIYCMSCLSSTITDSPSSNTPSYNSDYNYNSNSGGKVTGSGAGGYDMPNENDESFSDYVKRVDPELYNSLFSN